MIHQYKAKGFNIILDVYSGSVHLVDDVTYDIVELFDGNSKDYIKKKIQDKHNISDKEFEEALKEVEELKDQKVLFSEDDFKDLTIDISKKKSFLKAMCLNVSHTCNLSCNYCYFLLCNKLSKQ